MNKTTITRLFVASLITAGVGATVAIASIWIAIANDVFVMRGADIVGIQGSALAWGLLGTALAGAIAFTGALVGGLVSWMGALLATAQLERKTWFVALLTLGIFNLGVFAMIAFVLAGPDGREASASGRAPVTAGA